MSWFKKLSKAKRANPNSCCCNSKCNNKSCGRKKPHPTFDDDVGDNKLKDCQTMLASLCSTKLELVDPEDFFHDPDHVRHYKEEEHFLQIMSEWEIVEHPQRITANFFSADFEEELIQSKTQQNTSPPMTTGMCGNAGIDEKSDCECSESEPETTSMMSLEDQLAAAVASEQECVRWQRRFSGIFFGERIETGICIPNVNSDCKSNRKKRKRRRKKGADAPLSSMKITEAAKKDRQIARALYKSEAISHSIMGALAGQCSNSNGCLSSDIDYDGSSTTIVSNCDAYDIKQFFRLDDCGNIVLCIKHVVEVQGYEVKYSKKYCPKYIVAECAEEDFCQPRGWLVILKKILQFLWNIISGHPRNKVNPIGGPGDSVRCYTLQLASDNKSTFAQNIENFISCTKESREAAPQVVMRNMRQFMNGMKNYLVKHGEGKFHQEVESARSRLKSDEFLNLDAILETVMHQLVVLPLREHLYGMFVDYYTRTEDIQLLAQNVKYACGRSASDFGIRAAVAPPTSTALHQISNLLLRLQEAELPLEKLDLFLCIISSVFDATGCPRGQQLGADDFLPILVFVVAKCGFVGAEIEAEFMWGLLQPALLNGEAGYYLTALCSAVHVLKSFMASDNEGTGSLDWRSSSLPACSSVLRVIIPDECNGSLQTRTLPVRPHTTTREVCRIIAHKARITNPQDYALFKLVDGEETLLTDVECPQDIRLAAKGKHCMLAYKRIDAKIAWPTAAQPSYA